MITNKVIVTCRLSTGDDIDVSVKAVDRPFNADDRFELERRVQHSIIPNLDDMLYLKVRLTLDKRKDNWNKIKGVVELNSILDKIFGEC